MDQHAHRHGARAARSHGTVDVEHGATADTRSRAPQRAPRPAGKAGMAERAKHIPATVLLPIVTALAFGLFTIFRTHTDGTKGGPAMLYGLAAFVVSGALGLVVAHFQSSMITETRALAYGALFGCSMGWVYSLGGESVLKSSAFGLTLGAVMFVAALYVFRTHRVREPHGRHRLHQAHRPHQGDRERGLPVATH
ncbi:hypothetical protein SAMN05428945_2410 [Streptomyces sp. 2224.1]|uniref:hypothetical protein n=1 Tax=unclassified Streptomyces TaxID=2593676 RepID=UPI00089834B4|nr:MULTISPECIES: hypothetical protein [unclassified Streptomyces]SEC24854.1 hypothetical protein SAMN05428945_2410 [Streptomyces sp. 2224.1]SEE88478.1 hypothetical protein SAMN05428954_4335 [Streptomyces sp. 2112.3]